MSVLTRRIDARGAPCPQPVVLTKQALEQGGFQVLEVVVDNPAAIENVSRFASHAGHVVEGVDEENGTSLIRIRRTGSAGEPQPAVVPAGSPPARAAAVQPADAVATLFLASDMIGSGNDQLGGLLMRGFLATLPEAPRRPTRLILMNGGVRLAVEGSDSLPALRKLAESGVEILACGTCLDFYHLTERLAVGRVSNMFEIAGLLMEGGAFRP